MRRRVASGKSDLLGESVFARLGLAFDLRRSHRGRFRRRQSVLFSSEEQLFSFRNLSQLLERVLALCQLRANAKAVKKVLGKVKQLNTKNVEGRRRRRVFTATTTTTHQLLRLTNASLRCAYFTFCAAGDANAAAELLLIENNEDGEEDVVDESGKSGRANGAASRRRSRRLVGRI